ncbi:MAG: acetylxylan esterase [Mangrovibacterium sp.]
MKKFIFLFTVLFSSICFAQNSPQRFAPVQIILSPDAADWTYALKETVQVEVRVLKYGVPMPEVIISYQQANDMLKADEKGEVKLKDGVGKIMVKSTKEPGFRQLKASCVIDGKNYQQEVKLGFGVGDIRPTVKRPQDFDAFWSAVIKQARTKDFDTQLEKLDDYSTDNVNVYLWSIATGVEKRRISGYLCMPDDDEKHPVLFAPPGAGVKSFVPYLGFAEAGYISLSIEIHGINPQPNEALYREVKKVLDNYELKGMSTPDDYYYKAVYTGCVRAVDYLCSLDSYNGHCVATGGSQGGALAIVATALNEKVDAVAAFYPALSDITGFLHNRGGGWPRLFRDGKATEAQINTLSYYDVVNFAKRVNVPGFYSTGFNDNTCCPTSVFSVFNSISAPKELYITPPCGHWRFGIANDKSLEFLKDQVSKVQ